MLRASPMRVLVAYNEPVLPPSHPEADSEHEILNVVDVMAAELGRGRLTVGRCGIGRDLERFRAVLRDERPDVVFNLFEGLGDDPAAECRFARLLEDEGAAFTGCSSQTLWQAGRKDVAKKLFQEAGLPTPDFQVIDAIPFGRCGLRWPVIVKPAFRDASIGIDQKSVVTNESELRQRVSDLANAYGLPIILEAFIRGREISAAVVEWPRLTMLPAVETLFVGRNGDWPIVTYDSKWRPGSPAYESTPLRYPAELPLHVAERMAEIAQRAFRAVDCRDFATVDFRLTGDGAPYLLEINPNPGMAPSPCLLHSFELAGIRYNDYLVQMVHAAKSRGSQMLDAGCSILDKIQHPASSIQHPQSS
jgi:D-alanine-D-alanine ligase